MEKEFLYVGHYYDINNDFILKIGTTNNLERRKQEHTRKYRHVKNHQIIENGEFVYDWTLKLSHNNTLRYENKNREAWKQSNFGTFVRNDRFHCKDIPETVTVKIRKEYVIALAR